MICLAVTVATIHFKLQSGCSVPWRQVTKGKLPGRDLTYHSYNTEKPSELDRLLVTV